jgi:magnesium transporter
MITIYQEDEKKIIAQNIEDADFSHAPELSWIHVQNASSEILEKVSKVTGLSFDYLSSALDEEETAHIEADDDDDITYVVLDTPYIKDAETGDYGTAPFILVFNTKYFVTIANHEFELISELLKKVKKIETKKHVRLSTQFIYRLMTLYISYLKKIDQKTKQIDEQMSKNTRNKQLYDPPFSGIL